MDRTEFIEGLAWAADRIDEIAHWKLEDIPDIELEDDPIGYKVRLVERDEKEEKEYLEDLKAITPIEKDFIDDFYDKG